MKGESSFPNWFKNTFIIIGVLALFHVVRDNFEQYVRYVVFCYPLILFLILQFEKYPEEKGHSQNAQHYFNISLSIVGFFTLIMLVDYRRYIEQSGTFSISGNRIFLTDNPSVELMIYILTLLYFFITSCYLSYRIKYWIKSYEGIGAFRSGKKIWNDVHMPIAKGQNLGPFNSPEYIKTQKEEALMLFDKAIEKGYHVAEVFSLRGSCLNDLGFYFDAIEDYNKAIEKNPTRGIASNYHMRSLIKDTIFDYEGSISDIEEAIRLSKVDNDDNEFWNDYAKKTLGYNTATEYYEWLRDAFKRRSKLEKNSIDRVAELKEIKRR
jgi:tetratricopeptide (TPR) repeat protein